MLSHLKQVVIRPVAASFQLCLAAGTQQAAWWASCLSSSQNWWRKHYSGYFYTGFLLIKRQSGTFTDSRKKTFFILLWQALCLAKSNFKKGHAVVCQREIYFSPWPVSHSGNRNKGAVKTVIKLNWKHRYDFKNKIYCTSGLLTQSSCVGLYLYIDV